jgi:hypothetical protein
VLILMTKLLEKAQAEVAALPPDQQDDVARWRLAELAYERRWDESIARSQTGLERLADEAVAEHRAGRSTPLDPDEM